MKTRGLSKSEEQMCGRLSLSRRDFLKISALTGAGVVAGQGIPQAAVRAGSPAGETREGIDERWVATSCLNCSARCATRVRVVNGRAVSIIGNPLSRSSEGKICPRGAVGLQVLYDLDRLKSPLKRSNPKKGSTADPGWIPISWDQALSEVADRLKALRRQAHPERLLLLYGLNTGSDEDLIGHFAGVYGTPNAVSGTGLENEAEKCGRWMADGNYSPIAYDLDHTNYILAFGASILESQKPLARNLRMWGKIRRERPIRAKVVVIDPRCSVTADKADEWVPIYPGTDGALAMAVAHVMISESLYDASFVKSWTQGFEEFKELVLRHYPVQKVARITGLSADLIRRIAREFAQTRPAIAWVGTGPCRRPNGSYNGYAIFCLNALAGSIDVPGGIVYQTDPPFREMPRLAEDDLAREGRRKGRVDGGQTDRFPAAEAATNQVAESILDARPYPVEMAVGVNCNFSFSAPGTWRWDEALKKIPYYVHIAPFISEMAGYADLLLPACTFLEEWAYDHYPAESGRVEVRIKQPAVPPLADSRAVGEIFFDLAQKLGGRVARSFADLGGDLKAFVRYRTERMMSWDEFSARGVWLGPRYEYGQYRRVFKTPSRKFEFFSGNLERLLRRRGEGVRERTACLPHYERNEFLGDEGNYPLILLTYQPLMTMESGSQNYPWAQEIYLVMHGRGWTNLVELHRETAKALGIEDGDRVQVESSFRRIEGRARVFEGIHPQVVAIARGQGHYASGRWAKGVGLNPQEIIGVDYDRLSGQAAFFNTRVRVYKV